MRGTRQRLSAAQAIHRSARDGNALRCKLAQLSAEECFIDALEKIGANSYVLEPQDDSARDLLLQLQIERRPSIGRAIHALTIERQIRAMRAGPGHGQRLSVPHPMFRRCESGQNRILSIAL
jgi:hypothetical protein